MKRVGVTPFFLLLLTVLLPYLPLYHLSFNFIQAHPSAQFHLVHCRKNVAITLHTKTKT